MVRSCTVIILKKSCTVIFFMGINNEMSVCYKLLKSIRLRATQTTYV
jgi:hypothetical protein